MARQRGREKKEVISGWVVWFLRRFFDGVFVVAGFISITKGSCKE